MLGGIGESHHCMLLHANELSSSKPCREPNALLQMVIHGDAAPRLLIYCLPLRYFCSPIV